MKLRKIRVTGIKREWASAFSEFLLFHGVDTVSITDRPDIRKVEYLFHYASDRR